ncbi:MAG: GNAT family N-acetyltransferase [Gammaproteobacteria bacterium]|nr:GNAT family N-acetyltransferase [Gammaproteobacteria bacterium]
MQIEMQTSIAIRDGTVEDARCISVLLTELAEEFIVRDFTTEGRTHLLAHFSVSQMEARLQSSEYRFKIADKAGNADPGFTVNASAYAVPAYERLGFRCVGPVKEANGVRFQPMRSAQPEPMEPMTCPDSSV